VGVTEKMEKMSHFNYWISGLKEHSNVVQS